MASHCQLVDGAKLRSSFRRASISDIRVIVGEKGKGKRDKGN
jgi:hypothetical protein